MTRAGRVVVDGVLVSAGEPVVSSLDLGFLHGDSLFTTMAVASGRPVFWEDHLARLRRSAEFFGYPPLPAGEILLADCFLAIESSPEPPSALRLTLSRGRAEAPGIDGLSRSVLRVATPLFRSPPPPEHLREGVEAEIFFLPWDPSGDPLRGHKTGNLLWIKWVRKQRRESGSFEQILVSPRGEILEGTLTSVFGVDREGVLRTAPLSSGILPGIQRGRILAWAQRLGHPVREEALRLAELPDLRELFVSSATLPVRPLRILRGSGDPIVWPPPFPVATAYGEHYRSSLSGPS
ncbi:MAG: aminotransferase class IV [Leptospirillia bacterium]